MSNCCTEKARHFRAGYLPQRVRRAIWTYSGVGMAGHLGLFGPNAERVSYVLST
jgi:hypothetical protein